MICNLVPLVALAAQQTTKTTTSNGHWYSSDFVQDLGVEFLGGILPVLGGVIAAWYTLRREVANARNERHETETAIRFAALRGASVELRLE
jgi:hypothetical protein